MSALTGSSYTLTYISNYIATHMVPNRILNNGFYANRFCTSLNSLVLPVRRQSKINDYCLFSHDQTCTYMLTTQGYFKYLLILALGLNRYHPWMAFRLCPWTRIGCFLICNYSLINTYAMNNTWSQTTAFTSFFHVCAVQHGC